MRKILFFLHSLSAGGAERVTASLANHWARRGWSVTVVTITDASRDFYALDPRIQRIPLDMAADSRHVAEAIWHNLRRIRALAKVLSQEKPDVAVAMMATANVSLALAGRLTGTRTIGSERVHPPTLALGRVWEKLREKTYPLLDGMVAQTEGSADWLREHAPTERIHVIPNPVNYPLEVQGPRIVPTKHLDKGSARLVLLAVGRLEKQKGFDRLLAGFASIADQHPNWSLVILGQGSLHEALLRQAAELGVRDRVALPGVVGNVGEWFEAADLYALISRFEGFPNTLLEALAHGVPSVAVDCETGPREIVRHEVDGLLVPQDDPDTLAAALDRLMEDAELRARFSERAVEARERFAVERVAREWEQMFEECINGSRK